MTPFFNERRQRSKTGTTRFAHGIVFGKNTTRKKQHERGDRLFSSSSSKTPSMTGSTYREQYRGTLSSSCCFQPLNKIEGKTNWMVHRGRCEGTRGAACTVRRNGTWREYVVFALQAMSIEHVIAAWRVFATRATLVALHLLSDKNKGPISTATVLTSDSTSRDFFDRSLCLCLFLLCMIDTVQGSCLWLISCNDGDLWRFCQLFFCIYFGVFTRTISLISIEPFVEMVGNFTLIGGWVRSLKSNRLKTIRRRMSNSCEIVWNFSLCPLPSSRSFTPFR